MGQKSKIQIRHFTKMQKPSLQINSIDLKNLDSSLQDKLLSLENIKSYSPPSKLYYIGNLDLLNKPKVAIIGSRDLNQYAKHYTQVIAYTLSKKGFIIISGGAIGTDILAHESSFPNTIMISPSSLDIIYPKQNKSLILQIQELSLAISEYEKEYMPHRYSFLERNRLIISLADVVIIPHANLKSGSSSSAFLASKLLKPLFVLPHRLNESLATNYFLKENKAKAIFNIESFCDSLEEEFIPKDSSQDLYKDEVLEFIKINPSFEDALKKFGNKILEYEINGLIYRNGINLICK